MRRRNLATTTAMALVVTWMTGPVLASEQIVERWYDALLASDDPAFRELLADDAKIELRQLGLSQNKAEFLDALDNWRDIAQGLKLDRQTVSTGEALAQYEVCYRFPGNAFTNLETFTFADGQVKTQIQERLKEEC